MSAGEQADKPLETVLAVAFPGRERKGITNGNGRES